MIRRTRRIRYVASIISEALPYIQKFQKQKIVIKYGGSAMLDEDLKNSFARDVVLLKTVGLVPVVVHGGGPQVGTMLDSLGITTQFIGGMRVTDEQTMKVVEMVLGGQINKQIVSLIATHGGQAVGLTGVDGGLMEAQPYGSSGGEDLGYVGNVVRVNQNVLEALAQRQFIPVIAPIGRDRAGQSYNVNADLAAAAIARAVGAEKLLLLTDTPGVLSAHGELYSQLDEHTIERLIADGTIYGGMVPKVRCALDAVAGGVHRAHIIDGRIANAILVEIFTDAGVGTVIAGE